MRSLDLEKAHRWIRVESYCVMGVTLDVESVLQLQVGVSIGPCDQDLTCSSSAPIK